MKRTIEGYYPFLSALLKSISDKYSFSSSPDFKKICQHKKNIILVNHSTPLSWIPAMSLLAVEAQQNNGADRTPIAVMDHFFYSNPLTRPIAKYISQSDRSLNFEELVASFEERDKTDLVLFPEGAYTFFGHVDQINHFRSARFIELAIRTKAPIVMVVHKGSESWAYNLKLGSPIANLLAALIHPLSAFFASGLLKTKHINIPWLFAKIKNFQMRCEIYNLKLTSEDLNSENKKQILEQEAKKIQARMSEILEAL